MPADRQVDPTPGTVQLVSDLTARCPAADDEYRALRQLPRAAVARGAGLHHRRGNLACHRRHPGRWPRRHAAPTATRRTATPRNPDRRPRPGRRPRCAPAPAPGCSRRSPRSCDVSRDSGRSRPGRPRRRRTPAAATSSSGTGNATSPTLAAPAFGNAPPLQHDVLTPALLQDRAHRQAGLPTPDDIMALAHTPLRMDQRIDRGYTQPEVALLGARRAEFRLFPFRSPAAADVSAPSRLSFLPRVRPGQGLVGDAAGGEDGRVEGGPPRTPARDAGLTETAHSPVDIDWRLRPPERRPACCCMRLPVYRGLLKITATVRDAHTPPSRVPPRVLLPDRGLRLQQVPTLAVGRRLTRRRVLCGAVAPDAVVPR